MFPEIRMISISLFLLVLLSAAGPAAAQAGNDPAVNDLLESVRFNAPAAAPVTAAAQAASEEPNEGLHNLSEPEFRFILLKWISISTPILLLIALLFLRINPSIIASNTVNAIGLVLVIQATAFIVLAATDTRTLTAAIGLLGAITGYLFGTGDRRSQKEIVELNQKIEELKAGGRERVPGPA